MTFILLTHGASVTIMSTATHPIAPIAKMRTLGQVTTADRADSISYEPDRKPHALMSDCNLTSIFIAAFTVVEITTKVLSSPRPDLVQQFVLRFIHIGSLSPPKRLSGSLDCRSS
jgi:hypothetical protein